MPFPEVTRNVTGPPAMELAYQKAMKCQMDLVEQYNTELERQIDLRLEIAEQFRKERLGMYSKYENELRDLRKKQMLRYSQTPHDLRDQCDRHDRLELEDMCNQQKQMKSELLSQIDQRHQEKSRARDQQQRIERLLQDATLALELLSKQQE